jgi:putative acetyltransferase
MIIRKYLTTDCEEITRLFYDTVHSVNARDYSSEQLNVWATGTIDKDA